MNRKECVAMILAGGKGARLGALTNDVAKPAVHYGGKYRIIDSTLSNCTHSGIDIMGVLTQHQSLGLHKYIKCSEIWNLDSVNGSVFMLPSFNTSNFYRGTADAVYQNIAFVEQFNPEYLLILSGDQVYKMDYAKMLKFHKETGADATIAVTCVPSEDVSRFGIINTIENGLITEFEEKPKKPNSNLASMGIYIFSWSQLKEYLAADKVNSASQNDFGKDIIPAMLSEGEKLYAYQFDGYWRDVGTIQSLWECSMDLIADPPKFDLEDENWKIFTNIRYRPPCHLSDKAEVKRSITAKDCRIYGKVENSVLSHSVTVCEGAVVIDSVVMPGAFIGKNAKIHKSIIGSKAYVGENSAIGADDGLDIYSNNELCSNNISLIGPGVRVARNVNIKKNCYIDSNTLLHKCQAGVANKDLTYV